MSKVYGIDLGTTYSAIARMNENGFPEIVEDNVAGSATLPSAVFFPEDFETTNEVVIGAAAKEAATESPERVFQFFKRWMARTDDPEYIPMILDGRELTPIELSSRVLKRIVSYAAEAGENIEKAVITVPAYFDLEQREATKQAGKAAGIDVLATINEPTAAALCYCAGKLNEDRNVLVYDLGGGTFDVTLMQMRVGSDGVLNAEVICTDGSDMLGGKDWDDILGTILQEKYAEAIGTSVEALEPEVLNILRQRAETVKQKLTEKSQHTEKFRIDGMIKLTVTQEEFNARTRSKLNETMAKIDSVLARANELGFPEDVIDLVLLVGGSTKMPQVRDELNARFPGKVQFFEPEKAVAMGAVIAADYVQRGINVQNMTKAIERLNPNGILNVNVDGDGNINISDGSGGTVTMDPGQLGGDAAEKLKDIASNGGNVNSEELTEIINNGANGGIGITDLATRTFGVIVRRGNSYICRNHVLINTKTPCEGAQEYGVPGGDRVHLVLPVVQSISTNDEDPVLRPDPAVIRYEFPDAALQMKQVAMLELDITPGLQPGEPVDVIVSFDNLANLSVSMCVRSTGERTEQTVNFNVVSDEEVERIRNEIDNMNLIDDI